MQQTARRSVYRMGTPHNQACTGWARLRTCLLLHNNDVRAACVVTRWQGYSPAHIDNTRDPCYNVLIHNAREAREVGFDKVAYANQYKRDHYDRYSLMLPKDSKARLQEYARQRGESLNAVIIAAIEAYTGVPLSDD